MALTGSAPYTATCTLSYATAGTHSVTATYSGDTSTSGSTSPAAPVTVTTATTSAPAITSAASTSAVAGHAFTFTVTATGIPTPKLTYLPGPDSPGRPDPYEEGLPSGVRFIAMSNGTAILSGIPQRAGNYRIAVVARSRQGTASQILTITVAPTATTTSITASQPMVSISQPEVYTATITSPVAPDGTVAFTDNGAPMIGCQSVVLSKKAPYTAICTSTYGTDGPHQVTATYSGDASTTSSKSAAVSITVKAATTSVPTITSAPSISVTVGHAFTFTVTATGIPTPNLTLQTGPNGPTASTQYQGGLPSGVLLSARDNGTGVLSGTPKKTGVYRITIVAKNSQGTATQIFTLIVVQAAK